MNLGSEISRSSQRLRTGDTYKIGETIEFAMDFDREVEVEGTIHLSMRVGSDDANVGWRPAS